MGNKSDSGENTLLEDIVAAAIQAAGEITGHPVSEETAQRFIKLLRQHYGRLIDRMQERRLPRIALVGKRGAGKSSLLNALFDRKVAEVGAVRVGTRVPAWYTLQGPSGEEVMEVLDTRGVQEASTEAGDLPSIPSLDAALAAIRLKRPDIFLFLVKAKEVNAAVQEDLKAMEACLRACVVKDGKETHLPIVIGVVSQCDELEPPNYWSKKDREFYSIYWAPEGPSAPEDPSDEDRECRLDKIKHIREAYLDWFAYLDKLPGVDAATGLTVMPTAAYVRFRDNGSMDLKVDQRWNVEDLKQLIYSELPTQAQMDWVRFATIRTEQRKFANEVITVTALLATVIGSEPIPISDIAPLLVIQIIQIILIGFISGRPVSWLTASEFLGACGLQAGVGYTLREGFRQLLKFIPGPGDILAGLIAGGGTVASGILAKKYFIDGQKTITKDDKRAADAEAKAY